MVTLRISVRVGVSVESFRTLYRYYFTVCTQHYFMLTVRNCNHYEKQYAVNVYVCKIPLPYCGH